MDLIVGALLEVMDGGDAREASEIAHVDEALSARCTAL